MRKLGLLIAMFVLFGCAEQPQPAVLPIPVAVPAISGVDMLTGDTLAVTCDGQMAVSGELPHYTLSCDVAAVESWRYRCAWTVVPAADEV